MKTEYTNQSPKIFAGFYESILFNSDDLNAMIEYKYNPDEKNDTDYDIGNWQAYQDEIGRKCADWLFENLPNHDIIKSMKFKEIWSPREYNFMTDQLTLDCEIDLEALKNYCLKAHRDEFNKYLFETWSSYDGFISFVDNNIVDFEKEPDTEIMIEFYLLNNIDTDEYYNFCYDLSQETMYNHLEAVGKFTI